MGANAIYGQIERNRIPGWVQVLVDAETTTDCVFLNNAAHFSWISGSNPPHTDIEVDPSWVEKYLQPSSEASLSVGQGCT